jgi:hypothetical protein
VYSALLSGVLVIGYRSIPFVVCACLLGLLFAWLVARSGSLLGVAMVHGTALGTQFVGMPLVFGALTPPTASFWLAYVNTIDRLILLLVLLLAALCIAWLLSMLAYLCMSS